MTWEQAVVAIWMLFLFMLQAIGVFVYWNEGKRITGTVAMAGLVLFSVVLIAGVLHRGGFW